MYRIEKEGEMKIVVGERLLVTVSRIDGRVSCRETVGSRFRGLINVCLACRTL